MSKRSTVRSLRLAKGGVVYLDLAAVESVEEDKHRPEKVCIVKTRAGWIHRIDCPAADMNDRVLRATTGGE